MNEPRRHPTILRYFILGTMLLTVIGFLFIFIGWLENPQGIVPLLRRVAQTAGLLLLLSSFLIRPDRPAASRTLLILAGVMLAIVVVLLFL
jgi:hypothetical protein